MVDHGDTYIGFLQDDLLCCLQLLQSPDTTLPQEAGNQHLPATQQSTEKVTKEKAPQQQQAYSQQQQQQQQQACSQQQQQQQQAASGQQQACQADTQDPEPDNKQATATTVFEDSTNEVNEKAVTAPAESCKWIQAKTEGDARTWTTLHSFLHVISGSVVNIVCAVHFFHTFCIA